jgi:hypothetical protein
LEIDPLGSPFGGDKDGCLVPEILHQRGDYVGSGRTTDVVGSSVLLQPVLVDFLGLRIGVRAIEEHHFPCELGLLEDTEQVLLRSARLGKDHGFLRQSRCTLVLLHLVLATLLIRQNKRPAWDSKPGNSFGGVPQEKRGSIFSRFIYRLFINVIRDTLLNALIGHSPLKKVQYSLTDQLKCI